MLCRIAELIVDIPEGGGMAARSEPYRTEAEKADIVLEESRYCPEHWPGMSEDDVCYMESGLYFYGQLLRFNGMMLHASAVELDGMAYLFSGPCGMGKSTHTRIWQETFGEKVRLFNDDKPALRCIDGKWFAYGTPWSGKHGININMKVPLAGICFLMQAGENRIRRLTGPEAIARVISQTTRRMNRQENMHLLLSAVDSLIRKVPVFELENRPEAAAAILSRKTMYESAKEAGLCN